MLLEIFLMVNVNLGAKKCSSENKYIAKRNLPQSDKSLIRWCRLRNNPDYANKDSAENSTYILKCHYKSNQ